ncbi:MAG: relaxase domain-containing protein [Acidimicrobiaceae bacterium]|nr:relaxase domain-containing protein [Acidimicrobiaceae bacterium]
MLYAVSDDPASGERSLTSSETAVREAVAWLERGGDPSVNRGSHQQGVARQATSPRPKQHDPVAPTPDHHPRRRRSRVPAPHLTLGDPLLLWHVLVANLVEGDDGRWSHSLTRRSTAPPNRRQIFQAVATAPELTASLGCRLSPRPHVQEVAGVPSHLLEVFSKRRAEIEIVARFERSSRHPRRPRKMPRWRQRGGKPEREGERPRCRMETRSHRRRMGTRPGRAADRPSHPDRRHRPGERSLAADGGRVR